MPLSTLVFVPLKGSSVCVCAREGKCEDLLLQVAIALFLERN